VAQQENAPNKPVHLIYICGAVLLFFVLQWSIDWVWGYFDRYIGTAPSEFTISLVSFVVALAAGIITYRNDRIYTLANEVSSELKKVTWPTAKEVRAATMVVIVMSVISAVILGFFDLIWSNLTELVYG
jgi:preprotein translocase subunit SecE